MMKESKFKWVILENIVIYIIVAVLFWHTRSPWAFLLLLFVNYFKKQQPEKSEK